MKKVKIYDKEYEVNQGFVDKIFKGLVSYKSYNMQKNWTLIDWYYFESISELHFEIVTDKGQYFCEEITKIYGDFEKYLDEIEPIQKPKIEISEEEEEDLGIFEELKK